MSSYLEKYHLQKVEPVKNRNNNNSHADGYRLKPKVDKSNSVKIQFKQKVPLHRHQYFQPEEAKPIMLIPKTEQLIRPNQTYAQEHQRKKDYFYRQRPEEVQEEKAVIRSQPSLSFKSMKDISPGNKIMTSIQGFFTKILKSDNGCTCGNPCPHAVVFYHWVDVPYSTVKHHYFDMLNMYEQAMKLTSSNSNQSSHCSIENSLAFQTPTVPLHEQLRKNSVQIMKDIARTQSHSPTFQNQIFKERMKNILECYAYEDAEVGYIQGMNMILSGLLYHVKDEIKTFAVFRKLIYEMRNIYFNGFKECYDHIFRIKAYLKIHVHDLFEWFEELMVDLNVVCLPWVLSLLTCLVPLEHLHLVYTGFIQEGWNFFYRVCLGIIIYHKQHLLAAEDSGDVMVTFSATSSQKDSYDWEDIIHYGQSIKL